MLYKLISIILLLTIYIILYKLYNKNSIEFFISDISGTVIKGYQYARLYGYKTANLYNTTNLPCGIYNGDCQYGKITVWSKGKNEIEGHIHNFNKNIYGKKLTITNLHPVKHPKISHAHHCKLAKYFL